MILTSVKEQSEKENDKTEIKKKLSSTKVAPKELLSFSFGFAKDIVRKKTSTKIRHFKRAYTCDSA
jgi:hypothetical protein